MLISGIYGCLLQNNSCFKPDIKRIQLFNRPMIIVRVFGIKQL